MANYGGMRNVNLVFAEDEDNIPEGWPTHGTERHGFARETNSVSVFFCNGATNTRRRGAKKETPEEDATQGMYRLADFMRVPKPAARMTTEREEDMLSQSYDRAAALVMS